MAYTLKIIDGLELGRIDTFTFYSGEERELILQVYDNNTESSIQIPDDSVKTLTLHGSPDDIEIADADITVNTSNKSIFTVSLSEDITSDMISGDIKFQFVSDDITRIAILENGIKKITNSFE